MDEPGVFVAEVRAAGGRGSGLLIAPRLVLTALHVVLGKSPPPLIPASVTAKCRLRGDDDGKYTPEDGFKSGGPALFAKLSKLLLDATLVWPPPGTDSFAHDVALLAIAPTAVSMTADKARPVGLAQLPRGRPVLFQATGFPMFQRRQFDDVDVWFPQDVFCEVGGTATSRPGTKAMPLHVRNSSPRTADEWNGQSGAVLWDLDTEHLLGVMHARDDKTLANDQLEYWPLRQIPADAAFWDLAGLTAPTSPAIAVASSPPSNLSRALERFPIRFDRTTPAQMLEDWAIGDPRGLPGGKYRRHGAPTYPAVVVLRGHASDEPILFAQRAAAILAEWGYQEHAENYRSPVVLDCGASAVLTEARMRHLLGTWALRFGLDPAQDDTRLKTQIAGALAEDDRPRVIVLEHTDPVFGEGCRSIVDGVATLLATTSRLNGNPKPPILLLSLVTGDKVGSFANALLPAENFAEKEAGLAAQLALVRTAHSASVDWYDEVAPLGAKLCTADDMRNWLGETANLVPVPPQVRTQVLAALQPHPVFPMRFARQAVEAAFAMGAR